MLCMYSKVKRAANIHYSAQGADSHVRQIVKVSAVVRYTLSLLDGRHDEFCGLSWDR